MDKFREGNAFVFQRIDPKKVRVFIQEEDIILDTTEALNRRGPDISMYEIKKRRDSRL